MSKAARVDYPKAPELAQVEEDKRRRRRGSVLWRLRWHLIPWAAAAGLLAVAAVLWLVDWATGGAYTTGIAGWAALLVGATGAAPWVSATARRWRYRVRLTVAGATAGVWMGYAVAAGPGWSPVAALYAAMVALGLGYWRDRKIVVAPEPKPVERPAYAANEPDTTPARWAAKLGGLGGVLPKSWLALDSIEETREIYTLHLDGGKQDKGSVLAVLGKICSGLRIPVERLVIEDHPERDPSLLRLIVVTASPVQDTVAFESPAFVRDGADMDLELGRYADGEGRAAIPVYREHSAKHAAIVGGSGSGKSSLTLQMAVSLRAAGNTVMWYLDGHGGASSSTLAEQADWAPVGDTAEEDILDAAESIMRRRQAILRVTKGGLTPSADLPGLLIIVDECHQFFAGEHQERWGEVMRSGRKFLVFVWAATQEPSLESWGSRIIRGQIRDNGSMILLRTSETNDKNVLGIDVDPADLPQLPGFGYLATHAGRSAPFRADYLPEENAEDWFSRYPSIPLDHRTELAAGPIYADRHHAAEEEREALMAELDAEPEWRGRRPGQPRAPRPQVPHQATGDLRVTSWPTPPLELVHAAQTVPAREPADAVYEAVQAGHATPGQVMQATGYGKTQVHKLLGDLMTAGRLTKAGHGTYTTGHPEHGDD